MVKGMVAGSFSPLHYGHVRLLRACRAQCDHLAVIVHADEHIERFKGYTPEPLEDRLADLRDLRTVDAVLAGDGRSKAAWAKLLGADVIFVGPETVRAPWAGTTVWLPRTPGISSTLLRQREGGSA